MQIVMAILMAPMSKCTCTMIYTQSCINQHLERWQNGCLNTSIYFPELYLNISRPHNKIETPINGHLPRILTRNIQEG